MKWQGHWSNSTCLSSKKLLETTHYVWKCPASLAGVQTFLTGLSEITSQAWWLLHSQRWPMLWWKALWNKNPLKTAWIPSHRMLHMSKTSQDGLPGWKNTCHHCGPHQEAHLHQMHFWHKVQKCGLCTLIVSCGNSKIMCGPCTALRHNSIKQVTRKPWWKPGSDPCTKNVKRQYLPKNGCLSTEIWKKTIWINIGMANSCGLKQQHGQQEHSRWETTDCNKLWNIPTASHWTLCQATISKGGE